MRLIDADKFANTLQKISNAIWFKEEQKKPFETIINMLIGIDKEKYSPTAYDINKVVDRDKQVRDEVIEKFVAECSLKIHEFQMQYEDDGIDFLDIEDIKEIAEQMKEGVG